MRPLGIVSRFSTRNAATVIAALATAIGLLAAGPAIAQTKPIKVGLTTDLSGMSGGYARSNVNGVELAIEQINASGGVLGRKLELLVRDSQLKPDLGASHTRDLILRENADVFIGPLSSAVALTVSAVAKQHKKVVMMVQGNTSRLTTEAFHPYMFTIVPSTVMETRAMAEAVASRYKRIAFIGGNYEGARQMHAGLKEWLPKVSSSAEIVGEAWPKLGEPDYSSYITGIMSSKPDVIVSALWGADLIGFFKQAKPYGIFDKTPVASLLFVDDLKALGPDMPDGVLGQMRAPFFAIEGDRAAKFVDVYRAKYNEFPPDWAVMGYEGMQILAQSIQKAGTVDSDALVKAIEQIRYDGLRGTISFRAVDHQANVGSFIGTTARSDKFPFKTLTNISRISAEKIWPTPAELEQARAAAK